MSLVLVVVVVGFLLLQAVGVAVDAFFLVVLEGPAGAEEAGDAQADCDEEEAGPKDAVRDHCCCHDGCYGSADAVCAVHKSEEDRGVGEVGAEDVVES